MQILSVEDSAKMLNIPSLTSLSEDVRWEYSVPIPSYFLPKDSGAKVALSRIIANTLLRHGPVLLWITETGIWPSSEHIDLFNGYRLSHKESRSVSEAPVHIFDSNGDTDAFISILYLSLSFVWDIEILTLDRSLAMTISHDEWLEYRFAFGKEAFISEFKKLIEPSLHQGAATNR